VLSPEDDRELVSDSLLEMRRKRLAEYKKGMEEML